MKDPNVVPGVSDPGSTSTGLLARVRAQERDAWSRLAELYGPLVYAWCRRRGLQEEDAADVVQEVFRAVARQIGVFQGGPGSTFRGWLWTITRNKIRDHCRRLQNRPDAPAGFDVQQLLDRLPETLDESDAGSSATGGLVRRALEMIRPDFADASWQAFWGVMMEERPAAEVGAALGISVNAVYIAKSRVLRRLRDELGEDFL